MIKFNADGNFLGRIGALAVIGAAAFALSKIIDGGSMCPAAKVSSSCYLAEQAQNAETPAPLKAK